MRRLIIYLEKFPGGGLIFNININQNNIGVKAR